MKPPNTPTTQNRRNNAQKPQGIFPLLLDRGLEELGKGRKEFATGEGPLRAELRSRTGASYEVLRRLRVGEWTLLLSNTVVTEYEEVLRREAADLGLDPAEIGPLLDDLCLLAERHPRLEPRQPMLADPDDEALLDFASSGLQRANGTKVS